MNTIIKSQNKYRKNIKNNGKSSSVISSKNIELIDIKNKITKYLPSFEYDNNFFIPALKIDIENTSGFKTIDISKLNKEILSIEKIENKSNISLTAIDKLSFSSNELNSIINKIREYNKQTTDYIDMGSKKITMIKTKEIKIGG